MGWFDDAGPPQSFAYVIIEQASQQHADTSTGLIGYGIAAIGLFTGPILGYVSGLRTARYQRIFDKRIEGYSGILSGILDFIRVGDSVVEIRRKHSVLKTSNIDDFLLLKKVKDNYKETIFRFNVTLSPLVRELSSDAEFFMAQVIESEFNNLEWCSERLATLREIYFDVLDQTTAEIGTSDQGFVSRRLSKLLRWLRRSSKKSASRL